MGTEEKGRFYIRVPVFGGSWLELRFGQWPRPVHESMVRSVTIDWAMGPARAWTVGPVSEILLENFFQPSEQLSDSSLNCLAFPPVTLAALQFQQFKGWTLAIPTLSYQDTSANTSDIIIVIFWYVLLQPVFSRTRLLQIWEISFSSQVSSCPTAQVSSQSSPAPTGERSQVWRNVGYPANSSYVGSGWGAKQI